MKVAEELDFAEGAETEHGVIEGTDFLDRHSSFGREVDGAAYDSVCAFAY